MNINILISTTMNIPIYEQIVNQIRNAVVSGHLRPGEGLPSIRMLAKDLTISVITTKRAYEELEKEGIITSIPGRGFYVCKQYNDHLCEKQRINLEKQFLDVITESKRCELSLNEIIELVQLLYEGEKNG